MASQLRLHVLIPIAVLGLLGSAFAAYTMGKPPSGGNSGVPLVTTHADKPKPKPGPKPKPSSEQWVNSVEAWCAGVDTKVSGIDEPQTLSAFDEAIGEYVQAWDSAAPAFMKLGLPPTKKSVAVKLRANVQDTVKKLRSVFNHVETLDAAWIQGQLDDANALDEERRDLLRELGATKCLDNHSKQGFAGTAIEPAPLLINSQLKRYGKVVVLFYEPGADYDAIQTREARAGALAAHAGFVSVNVSKNREVAQLASQYGVLESPTVLIITRGWKLKSRLEGFYDRTSVEQAVKNS